MTLNLEQYKINKPLVEAWIKRKPDENPVDLIGEMAIATNCHIIIISYYVGQLVGFSDELNAFIERLKKFYNIKAVI